VVNRARHLWFSGLALGGLVMLYGWIQTSRPGVPEFDAWFHDLAAKGALIGDREFMEAISAATNTLPLVVATIVVAVGLWVSSFPRQAATLALAMILSSSMVQLTKITVERPRPEGGSALLTSYAWPSGHTAGALTFALALWFAFRWSTGFRAVIGLVLIPLAVAVGYSRVFGSLHWATDVLGGWLVAVLAVNLARSLIPDFEGSWKYPGVALASGGLACLVLVASGLF